MPRHEDCVSEEKLLAYLEGKLPADEVPQVKTHVDECSFCQQTIECVNERVRRDFLHDDPSFHTTYALEQMPQEELAESSLDEERLMALKMLERSESPDSLGKLNDYEVIDVLGRGGYGIVFEAMDKVLNRRIAIKILTPSLATQAFSRRRFIREARAAAAINHPNVVTIFGVEETHGVPFLVMELLRGKSLRERLRREPKLDVMDILRISMQVAQGLAAAHAQGIIHRDVKPGNIMLVDDLPRVKITDFGLARVTVENVEMTSRGQAAGTPGYMSPEQVRGEELDTRSDLFALGCVMYAMFSGHSPFQGRNVLEIARRIDGYDPPRLQELDKTVPEFVDTLVQRLLKKQPEERYQSAAEVADVLNRHLSLLNQTPTDRLPEAFRKELMENNSSLRRWSQGRIAAAVGTLALLGIGAAFVTSAPRWLGGSSSAPLGPVEPLVAEGKASGGTAPVAPVARAERQIHVTVAQSGNADCRTLREAVGRVLPGGTITVLDSAEYDEHVQLTDAEHLAGVRIVAAQQAILRSKQPGPVVAIQGVPRLQLSGFKLIVPQVQFGVEVLGECPGLMLTDLTVQRVANQDGSETSSAGLAFRNGAAGSAEQPIVARRVAIVDTNVGIVIGTASAKDAPVRHVIVEECRIQGRNRQVSTLFALIRRCEDVVVRRNIIFEGLMGLSILSEGEAVPQRCLIEHNTWYGASIWITLAGAIPAEPNLWFHHNLVVDSPAISTTVRTLPATDFLNNLAVDSTGSASASLAPFAAAAIRFPLLSLDPGAPQFLRPDFTQLGEQAGAMDSVPGCYSSPTR